MSGPSPDAECRAEFEAWLNEPIPGNEAKLLRKMVMTDRDPEGDADSDIACWDDDDGEPT